MSLFLGHAVKLYSYFHFTSRGTPTYHGYVGSCCVAVVEAIYGNSKLSVGSTQLPELINGKFDTSQGLYCEANL